jgi:hypothetical protein
MGLLAHKLFVEVEGSGGWLGEPIQACPQREDDGKIVTWMLDRSVE